jgi:hypothetical protein
MRVKGLRWTGVQALLFVLWLLVTVELVRRLGTDPLSWIVVTGWPLALALPVAALIWYRGRRYRRKLLDEEFR